MRLKHTILTAIAASSFVIACAQPHPPAAEHFTHSVLSVPPETDANIAVVERFLNGRINADAAAVRASAAPGFHAHEAFAPNDPSDVEKEITGWLSIDSTLIDQKLTKEAAECVRYASGKWTGDRVHYWGDYSATDKKSG